ncbi:DUF1311 domain-containing protein [Aureimonas fodinaquatilis]|uniref:DUF1311 domain-containing protein n=1 Tax=Aureimonas fodinaquatilis TaxID=2565783 RepID=A0A5B0DQ74_9HYPH|nr:lysozyme inhibitor LprI family protein [Aureimonas fodinaquatilis]KAA0968924.1 DUF1311 domain-containing protein [Aureimonas fodinaquatilis]
MRFQTFFILAIGFAGVTQPVLAQDCSSLDQAGMNQCAGESYAKADSELNAQYRELRQRLSGDKEGLGRLTTAQRNWIAFRDAECDFATAGVAGGSIFPTVQANCLETITRSRIDDFNTYLTCEEGDLSCPVPPAG